MSLPDRPVDGAEIATEWGQEIHDRVFAPRGCLVAGGSSVSAPNTHAVVVVPIGTATDDPGGWLDAAHNRVEAPVGAEGLYTVSALFQTDDLNDADEIRCYVTVNGTTQLRGTEGGEGSTEVQIPVNGHLVISAGDQIAAKAKKIGTTGAAVDVVLLSLSLIRIGAGYGA